MHTWGESGKGASSPWVTVGTEAQNTLGPERGRVGVLGESGDPGSSGPTEMGRRGCEGLGSQSDWGKVHLGEQSELERLSHWRDTSERAVTCRCTWKMQMNPLKEYQGQREFRGNV